MNPIKLRLLRMVTMTVSGADGESLDSWDTLRAKFADKDDPLYSPEAELVSIIRVADDKVLITYTG